MPYLEYTHSYVILHLFSLPVKELVGFSVLGINADASLSIYGFVGYSLTAVPPSDVVD